jgi:hypothetical protein
MSPLPFGEQAILDVRKLEDYCLDSTHPRGRHKARVFREALGIGPSDGSWLRALLLQAVVGQDATELAADRFGQRWRVDVPITRHERTVVVRTVWIVRTGERAPRFVSSWVL